MTYRFLFLQPDPLLILQKERVPGLLHVKIAATHLDGYPERKLESFMRDTPRGGHCRNF
jgi:hypothetical protein